MEKYFSRDVLFNLEQRFRVTFVNSLSGFKSLNLIGTQNDRHKTNLAIFNSVFHLGANPALMGFIVRPNTVERHTLNNIIEVGYFTVNHVNLTIFKQAHQTSARYPVDTSEFLETGLTPEYKSNFPAPFVLESKIKMGLRFLEKAVINVNQTILMVGEIEMVYFPDECLNDDGYLDIEKAETIAGSSLDGYHQTKRIARLSYAKPDRELTII